MIADSRFSRWLLIAGLALAYFIAGTFGLSLAQVNPSATAIWPPTGIALAALLLFGYRLWPGILVGAFLVNLTVSGIFFSSLMIAAGNTLEALLVAYIVQRFANGRHAFDRARDIIIFAFIGTMPGAAVSATVGVAALLISGLTGLDNAHNVWFTWWLGNVAGCVIVAPMLVLWANARLRWGYNLRRSLEALLLMLALGILGAVVFGELSSLGVRNYPIQFVLLPVVLWFAFRFGLREVASANFVLAVISVWGTILGFGPFALYFEYEAFWLLLGYLSVVATTALVLAAMVHERTRTLNMLRDSEERYRVVAETATDAIVTINTRSEITYINAAAEKIFGHRVHEMLGRELTMLMPDSLRGMHKASLARYVATGQRHLPWENVELTGLHKDGHEVPLEISFGEYRENGKHIFTGIVRDISERKHAEESQRWLATIVSTSSDAIIGRALDGTVLSWNQAAERMYGYAAEEMIGHSIALLVPPELPNEEAEILTRIVAGERVENHETERLCKDGTRIQVSLTISPILDTHGRILGVSKIARDITERKRTEERIRYLAQHDSLTGLPNRMLFRDRVTHAIAQTRRSQDQLAILFLDLDDFKHINDSLGHEAGDNLLQMVARRLQRCVREGDSVARMGGDEFVICLSSLADSDHAMLIAGKILTALREPFVIEQTSLHICASIGISLYPDDGENVEALMRAADTAMYHAKSNGRNNYQFFTPRLNETARRRLSIASRLHQALERDEFTLHYQPEVDLETGQIFAAEALLRWRDRELGPVSPNEFVRVAEETGLIVPLGEWVLRRACEQLRQWRNAGYPDMRMAVNLSPHQFRRPGFLDLTARILRQTGVPAKAVEMELTESVLMMQSLDNISTLEQLVEMGVHLAVDDFGTGYSSLAYLKRFPIHTLKIDRSFIDGIDREPNDTAIITAIIAMAQSLRLNVIAEGVESATQAEFLKMRGCVAAQGFFCREPVPAHVFEELLNRQARGMPVSRHKFS